jgi:hypothetical protein
MDARQVPTFRDARGLRIWAAEAFVGTVSRYESPTVDRVVAVSAEAARGPPLWPPPRQSANTATSQSARYLPGTPATVT